MALAGESQEIGQAQLNVKTNPFSVEPSTVEMGWGMCRQGLETIREAVGGLPS